MPEHRNRPSSLGERSTSLVNIEKSTISIFFFINTLIFLWTSLRTESSLFSATCYMKILIFMEKKTSSFFWKSPNLRRTVLRDYWADSDVRACYGDLLDQYFPKNIFKNIFSSRNFCISKSWFSEKTLLNESTSFIK